MAAVFFLLWYLIPNIALAILEPFADLSFVPLLISIFEILDNWENVKLVLFVVCAISGFFF